MILFIVCLVSLNAFFPIGLSASLYEINEKSENKAILYGDVLISPKQFRFRKIKDLKDAIIKERWDNRWTNNVVPYIFSSQYNEREKSIIRGAFSQLEQESCFKFVERTTQRDYLDFKKLDGCFSYVGKIGGRQLISLGDGCVYDFIVLHEILHVLGLEHEHQRPDRDNHIKVLYQNVETDKMVNFEKLSYNFVDLHGIPYDYQSIMHYDGKAFGKYDSKTGRILVTMVPLKDGIQLVDNYELTELDVQKLRILGKCGERETKMPTPDCHNRFTNCEKLKSNGFCDSVYYESLLQQNCALTCGFCIMKKSPAINECVDKHEKCPEYARRGFCSLSANDARVRRLCPRFCGLCSSSGAS